MNQVLQMQHQLMQGFLISENRLKKKQEELNQQVDTQITTAQKVLDKKRRKAEDKKEQSMELVQKKSKKVFTSLKQYRDFTKSIRQDLGKISKLDLTQNNSFYWPRLTSVFLPTIQRSRKRKRIYKFELSSDWDTVCNARYSNLNVF